jgi:hypothetical protein
MNPFDINVLVLPAVTIYIVTIVVTWWATHSPIAVLAAAFIKTVFFVLYFGYIFDGAFTLLDDWSYLEGGESLNSMGITLFNLSQHWDSLTAVGGNHFVYYLYNGFAIKLFGDGYYAPVACNILLTVIIAYLGKGLAVREFNLSPQEGKWFYLFVLLHSSLLAWSNIINAKDILVLLLSLLMLISISLFFRKRFYSALLLIIPLTIVLFFLRFYVPLLFVIAFAISIISSANLKNRWRYLLLSFVLVVPVLFWIGEAAIQYVSSTLSANFVNPLYGFPRILLTPIPFNTEDAYSFLDIPMLIHWISVPFIALGLMAIYRLRSPFSSFFLWYVLIFIGLYSVYGELQGPRHRVQLDYAFAVFQFMGIMVFIKSGLIACNSISLDRRSSNEA